MPNIWASLEPAADASQLSHLAARCGSANRNGCGDESCWWNLSTRKRSWSRTARHPRNRRSIGKGNRASSAQFIHFCAVVKRICESWGYWRPDGPEIRPSGYEGCDLQAIPGPGLCSVNTDREPSSCSEINRFIVSHPTETGLQSLPFSHLLRNTRRYQSPGGADSALGAGTGVSHPDTRPINSASPRASPTCSLDS